MYDYEIIFKTNILHEMKDLFNLHEFSNVNVHKKNLYIDLS